MDDCTIRRKIVDIKEPVHTRGYVDRQMIAVMEKRGRMKVELMVPPGAKQRRKHLEGRAVNRAERCDERDDILDPGERSQLPHPIRGDSRRMTTHLDQTALGFPFQQRATNSAQNALDL
jgi:hypothetical protein